MARLARKVDINPDTICPLFAEAEPPIYAKNVLKVRLQRIDKSTGSSRGAKVPLAKEDYWIDGEEQTPFEINPYKTTEEDLQEQFGCGEYWIDAFDQQGKVFPNGRRLVLGGPLRRKGQVIEQEIEDDETELEVPARGSTVVETRMFTMMEKMFNERARQAQDQAERERHNAQEHVAQERENSRRQMDMHGHFSEAMLKIATDQNKQDIAPMEVIQTLRSQIDSLSKKHLRDEEERIKDHRSEIEQMRRDREDLVRAQRSELEEERRRSRDDLKRRDDEISDLRKRSMDTEEELRRRWQRDTDELRSRHEKDLLQLRADATQFQSKIGGEAETRFRKLETENEELRKDIRDLERDNIKLERDLAKAQVPEPEAPADGGILAQAMPLLKGVAGEVLQKMMQPANQAPQNMPAQQTVPPDMYAEMLRQQYATQMAQAAQAPQASPTPAPPSMPQEPAPSAPNPPSDTLAA